MPEQQKQETQGASRPTVYKRLKSSASSPLYGATITFVAVVVGIIASIFSENLRHPLITGKPLWGTTVITPSVLLAVVFWAAVTVWILLFYLRQLVEGELLDTLQTESIAIQEKGNDIFEAVQTLPPRDFLDQFCKSAIEIHKATEALPRQPRGPVDIGTLEIAIQMLLRTVARLAKTYDAGRGDARYAANVMVFQERKAAAPFFPGHADADVKRFLPFLIDPESSSLKGILHLPKALSAVATTSGTDDEIEKICFPIFNECREGDHWVVLPGAPLAFANWQQLFNSATAPRDAPTKLKDLREAVHGLDNMGDFRKLIEGSIRTFKFSLDKRQIDTVEKYYDQHPAGKQVKSFLAFPLVANTGNAIGTLNVHCNQQVFLGQASALEAGLRQQTYAGIITPLVFELANLVSLWETAKP